MTTASDLTRFQQLAWKLVEQADRDGDYCSECEFCSRSGPAADEPATRECMLLYSGDNPLLCPAVDPDCIRDSLDAAQCEEDDRMHEIRGEWKDWRDFDARR